MWMLNFIPDFLLNFIINLVLLVGIAGVIVSSAFKYVIKYLPQIIPYRTALQIASVLLLAFGVYLKGGQVVEEKWRARVAELEAKIAIAEEKSKVVNETVKTVFVDKVKIVKEQQVVVQEKIKTVEVKVDAQCKITADTIDILNDAARGVKK
jgi:predicted outer membrane protein